MKLSRLLMAFLLFVPFLQSCLEDVADTGDPRDAIAKTWDVVDDDGLSGGLSYDVTISKDANESTRVLFDNLHNLHIANFYANIAGTSLTIPSQTKNGYTIVGIEGSINSAEEIKLTYSVDDGDGPKTVHATFGPKIAKKKVAKPAL